jgi:hypothetical protein
VTFDEQRDSKDTGHNSNQDGVVIMDPNSLTSQSFYQETERQFFDETKSKINQSRNFLIKSKVVEMPLENPAELTAKINRVSNMANDLHFMKKQFREHMMNKHSTSLAERNLRM